MSDSIVNEFTHGIANIPMIVQWEVNQVAYRVFFSSRSTILHI